MTLVCLLMNVLLAVAGVELLFWDAGAVPWFPVLAASCPRIPCNSGNLVGLLWIGIFPALAFGYRRAAGVFRGCPYGSCQAEKSATTALGCVGAAEAIC